LSTQDCTKKKQGDNATYYLVHKKFAVGVNLQIILKHKFVNSGITGDGTRTSITTKATTQTIATANSVNEIAAGTYRKP
jgi:hypothetical protein